MLEPAKPMGHAIGLMSGTYASTPYPASLRAQRLGFAPGECIYIGDAERDVLAARAAGMPVYVALFGYIPAREGPHEWPANGGLDTSRAVAELLDGLPRPL